MVLTGLRADNLAGARSSSRRVLPAVLALVAIAAALYVIFLRGGRDVEETTTSPKAPGSATAGGDSPAGASARPPASPDRPRVAPGTRVVVPEAAVGPDGEPLVAQPDPTLARTGPQPTRESVSDTGNPIRDHRGDERAAEAVDLPAPIAPGERTMSSTITAALYGKLAPIVRACGAAVPADARGDTPTVHVTLTVDVAGGQLTTQHATAVTNDITGPASEQVIACVRDRASDLTTAANGEPDRTDYVVQFPVRLRK